MGVSRARGRRLGAALLFSRLDRPRATGAAPRASLAGPGRDDRLAWPARLSRVVRRRRQSGLRALRLFAEDVVSERAVGVTRALADTREACDGVADGYARSNSENRLLCAMRERVQRTVTTHVPAGSHLLDLGCGPGTDAAEEAGGGFRVTAIDWSPAMVDQAQRRVRDAGVAERVDVRHLGIHEVDRLGPVDTFAAAYSNFGPLNCVADLSAAAIGIAGRIRPGGLLIASVIGRVCPWEIALYASRGDLSRA